MTTHSTSLRVRIAAAATSALLLTIPSIILRRMQKTGRLNSPLASIISCADDRERFARCSSSHRVVVHEHEEAATCARHLEAGVHDRQQQGKESSGHRVLGSVVP